MNDINERLSILIIEDNEMFRRLAIEMLSGHDSFSAKTGQEGVSLYKKKKPDITFLDIGLPDIDGHKVLSQIKEENPEAFVVMLTASNIKSDVKQSAEAGANGYVIKPFSRKKIKDSIDSFYEFKKKLKK